jgi:hypothetical protein
MERISVTWLLLVGSMMAGLACAAERQSQDYVVKEGNGLSRLSLGMTAEDAVRVMGEPDQNLYGFIFVHKLPDGTVLSYRIADDHVAAINLKGDAKSKYATPRSARFGMLRNNVILLYGVPDAEAVNKVFYHALGIGFFFNDNVLYEISIVPANKVVPLRP